MVRDGAKRRAKRRLAAAGSPASLLPVFRPRGWTRAVLITDNYTALVSDWAQVGEDLNWALDIGAHILLIHGPVPENPGEYIVNLPIDSVGPSADECERAANNA